MYLNYKATTSSLHVQTDDYVLSQQIERKRERERERDFKLETE